jgi:hypothetical protein
MARPILVLAAIATLAGCQPSGKPGPAAEASAEACEALVARAWKALGGPPMPERPAVERLVALAKLGSFATVPACRRDVASAQADCALAAIGLEAMTACPTARDPRPEGQRATPEECRALALAQVAVLERDFPARRARLLAAQERRQALEATPPEAAAPGISRELDALGVEIAAIEAELIGGRARSKAVGVADRERCLRSMPPGERACKLAATSVEGLLACAEQAAR